MDGAYRGTAVGGVGELVVKVDIGMFDSNLIGFSLSFFTRGAAYTTRSGGACFNYWGYV